MTLLATYLPDYSFREVHSCTIAASTDTVISAAADYTPEADPIFRTMIGLREVPMRLAGFLKGTQAQLPQSFGMHNFELLERRDGSELAYGLVGRFWRFDFGLVPIVDGSAFLRFDAPGVAKLALGFSAERQENGTTRLVTETRIFCPDRATWLKFAPYWYLIYPASALIRRRVLAAIKKSSEAPFQSANL
ncbi:hypothetical protein GOZ78_23980 [Agrobacterium vitis]|uniref:DUF2867 domain-containing protein n=1 Tax=Agrobacterium vitis TaxID=373 RepID=A0ABD6GJI2_AGRVI|nr:hypothetical protein [Agrobacterium vitis]MUO82227.1 hypothetical protein [Agrobacterium vitis]MUO97575.1 hypothetical protein [Agrobacterium vitis]MUP08154.1 hypothetical protein [Agrobacterium vitis]MUZ85423.1 hypothetical protein [Agrobacterium vitis]MVA13067.1 hypothetical protein [Agrobacterium vitis]